MMNARGTTAFVDNSDFAPFGGVEAREAAVEVLSQLRRLLRLLRKRLRLPVVRCADAQASGHLV